MYISGPTEPKLECMEKQEFTFASFLTEKVPAELTEANKMKWSLKIRKKLKNESWNTRKTLINTFIRFHEELLNAGGRSIAQNERRTPASEQ